MAEPVYTPPPRTMLEVYQSLPEGTLAQLINNQIFLSPVPSTNHQIILGKLFYQLYHFVEKQQLGQVLMAPIDVYLNRRNAFQPDIVFIAAENAAQLKETGFYGAPDLVIEILSPGTWRFDKEDKKYEYERSGVKEYWMVDPRDKTTEGFVQRNQTFEPIASQPGRLPLQTLEPKLQF